MIVNVFVEPGLHPALTSTFKKAGWLLSAVRTFPNESHFTTSQLEAAVPASSFPNAWDAYSQKPMAARRTTVLLILSAKSSKPHTSSLKLHAENSRAGELDGSLCKLKRKSSWGGRSSLVVIA